MMTSCLYRKGRRVSSGGGDEVRITKKGLGSARIGFFVVAVSGSLEVFPERACS